MLAQSLMKIRRIEGDMPIVIINQQFFQLPMNTPLTELADWIDFGCRVGACGVCAIKIIHGQENLSPMDEEEKDFITSLNLGEGGYRLACQCNLRGDIT